MVLLLTLYALFASTFILGREVALSVPPILFIGIRMLIAGILLLGFIRFYKKEPISIKKTEYPLFLGIIVFHIYIAYVFEYVSLQYLSAAKASLLYNLSPFITALFSFIFLSERLSLKKWAGMLIGFLAFAPILMTQSSITETLLPTWGFISEAECLLLIAISASCIGWIFMKKLIVHHDHSYVLVNGIGMFFGGIAAFATSYFYEVWPSFGQLVANVPFMRGLILLILIGNIICYNLYGKLLHVYSTTILSFFGCCTPLFAALIGWFWLGESVSPYFFVTAFFAAVGLYIFYQEELKDGLIKKNS